ncbi:uncharacterized protein THITE_133565 [Thermothielavioides terrestris NRRL 8126]|uniref:Nuclear distribution protein n=1 Tax=Thermothielavioides terrestris (strain ATCC 38088 / NRRL 8126) TaxID=578455 RepID=G2R1B6_THETT|nr:uncharacterized protein THITE_133565 [Thermothielavioides terrestris NRRL 8126]AEO64851.1 hypothetical protein THITE_133565 [Thermothielavioides terrestris NRRL 8126]
MDHSLDQTTLATISLLEARLLRIEHILYGPSTPPTEPPAESATTSLAELEHRFNQLLRHFHKSHPTLFQSPSNPPSIATTPTPAATIPTQLPPEAVRATVLAYASAFPTTASALTAATTDTPVPDAQQSAALAALGPRLRAVAALQRAQSAEMAALRRRSERALRAWYEGGVLRYGDVLADVEGRFEKVERAVRRAARAREEEGKV